MASRSFVTFCLNNQDGFSNQGSSKEQVFGIDILLIREINRQLDMTAVPQSSDYICGLLNLRGQVVTLLDLNQRLGFPASRRGERAHNIILKTDQELQSIGSKLSTAADKVGLLIDEIQDVVSVQEEDLEAPPASLGNIDGQFLSGVIKQPDHLIGILSMDKLLK